MITIVVVTFGMIAVSSAQLPVDGVFGAWSTYGPCKQFRLRTCTDPPPSGGGATCTEQNLSLREERQCDVDCEFTEELGDCSASCGQGERTVTVLVSTQPEGNGMACPTNRTEPCGTEDCCPVDCVVGDWVNSTMCSNSVITQTRSIITSDECGGDPCPALSRNIPCTDATCIALSCDCFVMNADTHDDIVANNQARLQLLSAFNWPQNPPDVLKYSGTEITGTSFLSVRLIRIGSTNTICIRRISVEFRCAAFVTVQVLRRTGRVTSQPTLDMTDNQATSYRSYVWTTEGSTNIEDGCSSDLISAEMRFSPDRRTGCTDMSVRNIEFYTCSAVSLNRDGSL